MTFIHLLTYNSAFLVLFSCPNLSHSTLALLVVDDILNVCMAFDDVVLICTQKFQVF